MISQKSSVILNNLKIILPFFVVCDHLQVPRPITWFEFHGELGGAISDYYQFALFQKIFADVFCGHCCVPTFFFISGYLFFLKYKDTFSERGYIIQLNKRVKSLLIPFLIANLVYFVISGLRTKIISENLISDLVTSFWSYQNTSIPINGPLWYIRNLLGLSLLSPLIFYWVKSFKHFGLFVLFFLWMIDVWFGKLGFDSYPFFIFSCGAYLAICGYDIIDFFKSYYHIALSVVFPILLIIVSYVGYRFGDDDSLYAMLIKFLQLMSISFWFVIVRGLSCYFTLPKSMVSAMFFVYLYHYGLRLLERRIIEQLDIPSTDMSFLVCYFGGAVVVIAALLMIYFVIIRISPKLSSIVVGGR